MIEAAQSGLQPIYVLLDRCGANWTGEVGARYTAFGFIPLRPLAKAPVLDILTRFSAE